MLPRTLSELFKEAENDPRMLDRVYLAIEVQQFREAAVEAVVELSIEIMNRALEDLAKTMEGPFDEERCLECETFSAMVEQACTVYVMRGATSAQEHLDHSCERHLEDSTISPEFRPDLFLRMIRETSQLFGLLHRTTEREIKEGKWNGGIGTDLDPEATAAKVLSLSNIHRLNLMLALKERDHSFSELSRMSGLQTGHLQFHLNSLIEQSMVDRAERGIYRLTKYGLGAMAALSDYQRFVQRERSRFDRLHGESRL